MDALREFLEELRKQDVSRQHFLGLLHLLIGHRLSKADGTVISQGLTWREVAALLKRLRWDKEYARLLGLNPAELPARDRERYWYQVIARAGVDSPRAREDAARLADWLRQHGYVVGSSGSKGSGK